MVFPKGTYRWIGVTGWVITCLLPWAGPGRAEGFRLESAGVRSGVSANPDSREFYQAQAFGNWTLPWDWDLGKEWHLQSRLDFSAGWLSDHGEHSAIGTIGPTLVLGRARLPVSLEGGFSPTLLSRHVFPEKDVGTYVQFTSHVGLNWDFAAHWQLGYRFEHISNAGLSSHNPGLNMHLLGLTYRF